MALLTKAEILAANDIVTETVKVPEWGGAVRVRSMTGEERDYFETRLWDVDSEARRKNFRASLLAYSIVDESGNLLFTEEEIDALGSKSAKALIRVYDVAARLSKLTKADEDEIKNA